MKYFDFLDNEDESVIKREIENEDRDVIHGIIVFNIDNFIIVNEMYGRAYGDRILSIINEQMSKMFRGTDIVVKLRGDEFIVFTKDIKEINNIEVLASKLLDSVSGIRAMDSFFLTASVGLAIYPFHGKDYNDLKNKAYQAMLRAKANGKNSYRLYDSARTKALYHDYQINKDSFDMNFTSEEYFNFDIDNRYQDICIQMFREDKDALSAMNSIMELTCLYLGFSRAYMYNKNGLTESQKRKLRYANSGYEFGKESEAKKAILNDLHIRLEENYKKIALIDIDDDGVDEEVRITLEDEGVFQLLYIPLYNAGEISGAFILENLSDQIVEFTDEELEELSSQMSSIQSYFYNTYEKRFSRETLAKLEMFENFDACVYIIDAKTHCIEFANSKALSKRSATCIGELCYDVLCGKKEVCSECPLKGMNPDDPHAKAHCDLYNYSAREWDRMTYSWMDVYENRNKAVVLGVDVSDYLSGNDVKTEK